jgi:hypothetical protein
MCSGAHFSFPICVYGSLGRTGNPFLVYVAGLWEKDKDTTLFFFLEQFHIFQPLIRTSKKLSFAKIFKSSVTLMSSHLANLNLFFKKKNRSNQSHMRLMHLTLE